jgi:hypothetical protein
MGAIFYENQKLIKTKLVTWNKYSIKSTYKWDKYSCNSSYHITRYYNPITKSSTSTFGTFASTGTAYSDYGFSESKGFYGTGSTINSAYNDATGYYYFYDSNDYVYTMVVQGSALLANGMTYYQYSLATVAACSTEGTYTYSKGSTSYGTVTSTSRNTYPDNDKSGDYWYIYKSETKSKGTLIETVKAKEGTYPSNGIQGDYYYVLVS